MSNIRSAIHDSRPPVRVDNKVMSANLVLLSYIPCTDWYEYVCIPWSNIPGAYYNTCTKT